jgi:hypothetical protein
MCELASWRECPPCLGLVVVDGLSSGCFSFGEVEEAVPGMRLEKRISGGKKKS